MTEAPRTEIRYANAPVTWGIWGAHTLPEHRTPEHILRAIEIAGYDGVELGPLGLFGTAAEVRDGLDRHQLSLAGAYVPIRFLDGPNAVEEDLAVLEQVCRLVAACEPSAPIILAGESVPAIQQYVGRGASHPELDLDAEAWRALLEILERARTTVSSHRLIDTFHPHTGTYIEQPHEVDRLLEASDIALTLDTGHAAAGGDDPLDLLRRWSGRVAHVHLKDIDTDSVTRAQREERKFGMADAAVPLGVGDLQLDGFLAELDRMSYTGWVVVEQDRRPDGGHDHAAVDEEQRTNLAWIRERGTRHQPSSQRRS